VEDTDVDIFAEDDVHADVKTQSPKSVRFRLHDDEKRDDAVAAADAGLADVEDSHDDELDSEPVPSSTKRYIVQAIQGSRRNKNQEKEFQVRWAGYSKPTWEPAAVIEADAPAAVAKYEEFVQRRAHGRATRSQAAEASERAAAQPEQSQSDASSSGEERKTDDEEQQVTLAARDVAAQRL
jgi:hypothetical protein